MLEQEKIGKYIAQKRKGIGLTQKELAERVGLTDKAVSKWERGKSIPDHDVMRELCRVFDISVNELLSGEDIVSEDYPDKAEQNMIALVSVGKSRSSDSVVMAVGLALGIVFLILGICSMWQGAYGEVFAVRFVEFPSLLFVIGLTVIVLVVSGLFRDFIRAFSIVCSRAGGLVDSSAGDYAYGDSGSVNSLAGSSTSRPLLALKVAFITNLLAGLLHFVSDMIVILPNYGAVPEGRFPAVLSIELICIWYALLLDLVLVPIYFRLRKK